MSTGATRINKKCFFLVEALTFLYLLYQVKDEGLVDNEKNEDEETPQEAENEDSIIGAVETI